MKKEVPGCNFFRKENAKEYRRAFFWDLENYPRRGDVAIIMRAHGRSFSQPYIGTREWKIYFVRLFLRIKARGYIPLGSGNHRGFESGARQENKAARQEQK